MPVLNMNKIASDCEIKSFFDEKYAIEDERFQGKYVIQRPDEPNCGILAMANVLIDYNILNTKKEISDFVFKYSKKYNILQKGLSVTLFGGILYEYGIETSMNIFPGNFHEIYEESQNSDTKIIRIFAWNVGFRPYSEGDPFIDWYKNFTNKYKIGSCHMPESRYLNANYTTHAMFVEDIKEDGSLLAVNYGGIRSANWFDLGGSPFVKNLKICGSELVIICKKTKKYSTPTMNLL